MEQNRETPLHSKKDLNSLDEQNAFTDEVIPIIQENTVIHNEEVETGKVHIKKTVSKEDFNVNTPIINEVYDIERVPIKGQVLDTPPPAVRNEGDTIVIPVLREIAVMVKRYEIVEEIRITKKTTETPLVQKVTLSKQNINIERTQTEPKK
jgi:uncharacterized protein (TIGR02271 family)